MPENPILLVATRGADASRRGPAPRSTKEPLVDTRLLKPRLVSELDEAVARAEPDASEFGIRTFPLQVVIDERAIAKTSRPTALLEDADIKIEGSLGPGRIVGAASLQSTARLRSEIASPSKAAYEYEISTVRQLRLWEASTDAFGLGSLAASEALVRAAADAHFLLKFELFPWLTLDSNWGRGTFGSFLEDVGFELLRSFGNERRTTAYLRATQDASAAGLSPAYGIRAVQVSPRYRVQPQRSSVVFDLGSARLESPPNGDSPVVGVLDTGIQCGALEPWVVARESYDPATDVDSSHGTFVAGLIVAPRALNDGDARFPDDQSRVVDAQVLPAGGIDEPLLLERITEVVQKYQGFVKVWNCSFAASAPIDTDEYSTFAQEMDSLARAHGVMFVQAAGNYESAPTRFWPPDASAVLSDGIASPADAIDSLTVSSLSHLGGMVPEGAPATYSRRGPGTGGMAKPDVAHWSGDMDPIGQVDRTGVKSFDTSGAIRGDIGTSFATPIVATTAANVWADLESTGGSPTDAALAKGLVVHSALLSESRFSRAEYRDYLGAGTPSGSQSLLFGPDDLFTTVHAVDMVRGYVWWKKPFPVPECLIGSDGKFRGEVFLTLSYQPVVDAAFGAECVRTNVDAGFGLVRPQEEGNPRFASMLQTFRPPASRESEQILDGKWSPIKTYHGRFPRGKRVDGEWALRLSLLERADSVLGGAQRAYALLSFRSLERGLPVYRDGVVALRNYGYAANALVAPNRIRLRPGG